MLNDGLNGLPGTAIMTTISKQAVTSELKRDSSLALTAVKRFSADQCTTLAASIAFYAAFSLAPTLLMVIAVAGWFFGAEAARGQLFGRVHDFLGNEAAAAIQAIVENAHRQGGTGIAALTSIALLIVGASATFSSLNTALDVVFPALPREKRSGIALMVRVRLISFGLVLGVAFLLVVSLVLDTVVTFVGNMVWGNSPFVIVTDILQMVISLAILSFAFTALMKLLPDADVKWRDALVGGVVSAVLFTIGKKLFAMYLAHAGTASAFGAAGSLAVLLMWLYFSSAVLLLGAEFAAVKGGFGERKDKSAAAAAEAMEKHGQATNPVGSPSKGSSSALPQWVPESVRHSPALRMVGLGDDAHPEPHAAPNGVADDSNRASPKASAQQAGAAPVAVSSESVAIDARSVPVSRVVSSSGAVVHRSDVEAKADSPCAATSKDASFGMGRFFTSRRKPAAERRDSASVSAIDAMIARSKHPFAFRLALQAAPLAFQGISLLLPVRRNIDTPVGRAPVPVDNRAQLGWAARLFGSYGDAKAAGQRTVSKGAVKSSPTPKAKHSSKHRSKHPLTAALFAAGTGLILASLANRDRRR